MSSPRRSQARIAYSSTFALQSAFGTALGNGALDAVFNLSDEEPKLEFVTKDDRIIDCTGQYSIDEVILSRYCRLSFGIEVEAAVLNGLVGWAFGTVSGDDSLMLSPSEFTLPVTSFIYGFVGGAQNPLKLKDMALASIRITGRVNERVKASVAFVGHGAPVAGSFTFPDCSTITPVYLKDGAFTINSVSHLADCREFEFGYDNKPLIDEDPFTLASIDVTRIERADQREYLLKCTIFGEPNDTLEAASRTNPKTKYAASLRIGSATAGVTFTSASAIFRQRGTTFDGEARRNAIQYELEPVRLSGNANTPVKATHNVP